MFTPKTNSKQKRVKQTQEHETRQAATEQFARRALTLTVASSHLNYSPWRPSHSSWRVRTGSSRELNTFHSKIPILTSQCPNLIPKLVWTFLNMKRHSNSYKTWTKISFLQNHYFHHWTVREANKDTRCGKRWQTALRIEKLFFT